MNASDHHSVACWDRPSHPIYPEIGAAIREFLDRKVTVRRSAA
jgi:hypothetical protein